MRLSPNHHFDAFKACFICCHWNPLTVTPSFVCFPPNSEADNNHQCIVVLTMKTLVSRAMKYTFEDVYL